MIGVAEAENVVFDRATLDENTMSDPDLQAELFALYFGHAPRNLDAMRAGLEGAPGARCRAGAPAEALRQWTDGAHAIKGTARTLGFLRLAAVAAEAEAAHPCPARLERVAAALTQAEKVAAAHRLASSHVA